MKKTLIILICFMGALSSCASDYAAETHITFTNNSSHEISILNTEYTDFELSVLVSKNCSVSKTVGFQGEGIKIVFTSNSLKYEAALYPSESRWFTICFSDDADGIPKCEYKWIAHNKEQSKNMPTRKIS